MFARETTVRLKGVLSGLAIVAFAAMPVLPVFDHDTGGAAYAKDGKGGGNGNGGGNDGGKGKSDPSASKSTKSAGGASADGNMNGALKASMSAVLAKIRNGQTTDGPVGLLAGLAVADTRATEAGGTLAALQGLDRDFRTLDAGLAGAGFASVEEYLMIRSSGILTEDEMAVIDPLIAAVGGTTRDGTRLAVDRPMEEDLQDAADRLADARDGVGAAEGAIAAAMNGGDPAALLAALRRKLAADQARISAALD